jgi:Lon protease-like protein
MKPSPIIPLFPLGMVLLPGTALPLHIFEERFKSMINDCSENHQDFGIVYYNGSVLRRFGCTAHTVGVVQTYDDGRLDILTSGNRRYEILELIEGRPYVQAKVRFFDDQPEDGIILTELAHLAIDTLEELAEQAGKRFDRSLLHRLSPQALSFVLANTDLLNLEERQEVLEDTSCHKRLELLVTAGRRSMERLTSARRLQTILGTTGDITHLFN